MIEVWIDTGGTFTDCIIKDGAKHRYIKVLSDGSLRAKVIEQISGKAIKIEEQWEISKNIISGYDIIIGNQRIPISNYDVTTQTITTQYDCAIESGDIIQITAGEEAPILAIRKGLELTLEEAIPPIILKLGTTKGTNALLESKGAKVLLYTTKGFKDLTLIGTQQRPHIFQIDIPHPKPLFHQVIEVEECIDSDGKIISPLASNHLEDFPTDIDSVAISFKNAYVNNAHEEEVCKVISSRATTVSISSRLQPQIKFLNRTQSTLINAYLAPILEKYFSKIKNKTPHCQLSIMSSTGTLLDQHSFRPMDSLLSGPAGGLKGAVQIAQTYGIDQLITFDMGGTSTDVARYGGKYDYQYRSKIGEYETSIPSLYIETVAAGGGSICSYEDGLLKVGPESAGAFPGPACYGQGGPLTITDVNLLLGKIHAEAFQIPLDISAAEHALDVLAKEAEMEPKVALLGLEKIANQIMGGAIRKISIRQGFHPKEYAMVSFGGAGGLHACKIAEEIGVSTIIFPYVSGLLSAYGIGKSATEKIFSDNVLQLLDHSLDLNEKFRALVTKAQKDSSFQNKSAQVKRYWVNISIKGQEGYLDIPWNPEDNLRSVYDQKYKELYGFLPKDTELEVNSIHLLFGEVDDGQDHSSLVSDVKETKHAPIVDWASLREGQVIKGPTILYNGFGTVFLEEGWKIEIGKDRNGKAILEAQSHGSNTDHIAIQRAVFSNRFQLIAEEMGEQLERTAYSVNIKERLDFSCGILNKDGLLLANAPHIPVHLGSLGVCGRSIIECLGSLNPGDIILTNHPKYGGSHLPDLTLMMPVFVENTLIGYVINRAHHAEIGGSRPGSMPPDAATLEEEGVVFPPTYVSKSGKFLWEKIENLLSKAKYPSRSIRENIADLKAGVASLLAGEKALVALADREGSDVICSYMDQILENTSDIIDNALSQYKDSILKAEEKMDDGRMIALNIQYKNGKWIFDFTGTDTVHPGNLNANIAIVQSAVLYVLRLIANRDIPLNEGLMQNIQIIAPESFLNPTFSDDPSNCPAVVGGNTEVSQRLVDTLIKAFGLSACSQGTMNNVLFGNDNYGYYETICGGSGASAKSEGRSGVHQHMTNTRITDPEDLERNYPVRLRAFSIRNQSGGKGKNKGGDGIIRKIEFLEESEVTIISQHRKEAPYGMEGGESGMTGEQSINQGGKEINLDGVSKITAYPGDILTIETPGGGGWGKE